MNMVGHISGAHRPIQGHPVSPDISLKVVVKELDRLYNNLSKSFNR